MGIFMNESRLRRFVKNGLLMTAVSLTLRMIAVRFNSFISMRIGANGMGLYTLIMSIYGFAVTVASAGVNLASNRMCAEAKSQAERKSGLKRCFVYALGCGILSCSLLLIFGKYIGEDILGDIRCVTPIRLLALSMPPIALSSVINGYFSALRKVYKSAVVSIFEQLIKILLTVLLLLYILPDGIEYSCIALVCGGMLAECASFAASLLLFLLDFKKSNDGRENSTARQNTLTNDGRENSTARQNTLTNDSRENSNARQNTLTKKLLSITLPVAAAAYVRSALTTIEHILIPRGLRQNPSTSEYALALYGIFCGMVMPVIMLPTALLYSFTGLLITEFAEALSRGKSADISTMSAKTIELTFAFSVCCAAFMYSFSTELGQLIYQSVECGKFIKIMSPLIPVMYLDHAVDSVLKGLGEQIYCMKVNILDAAMCTLLVYILCPKIGMYGYILTIYVSEAVNASLSILRLCKKADIRLNAKKITMSVIGAIFAMLFTRLMPTETDRLNLVFRAITFLGVYLLCTTVFRKKGFSPLP